MKPKMMFKMAVDLAMTVLLFLLMAYLLVGETAHEWLGLAMFLLFILHHVLNWRWYRSLFKGKYTPIRILQTLLNILLLASMIGLMVSGIILSRKVFDFLPVSGGMGFARMLHMLASYWGFLFMSLHLGLHWSMVMGLIANPGFRFVYLPLSLIPLSRRPAARAFFEIQRNIGR